MAKIAELAETLGGREIPSHEARSLLATLHHDYADFEKFLARRFSRLPERQQRFLIELLRQAQAQEFTSLLQQWSRDRSLPLPIRVFAIHAQEQLGRQTDTAYRDALLRTVEILDKIRQTAPAPLTDTGELLADWRNTVLDLPLALALDLAHAVQFDQPHTALAIIKSLRPIVDAKDRVALIECLAEIVIPESATMLLDILHDTSDKTFQKTVKKALHRLKARGLAVESDQQRPHTAFAGTVTHRLEKCLASHIDGAGDRALWMVRTKAFEGV
jgi:hypothetical protein